MDAVLTQLIKAKIQKYPGDFAAYEDLFSLCRADLAEHKEEALHASAELREMCEKSIRSQNGEIIPKLIDLVRRTLLFEAPYVFDSYLLYLEINRKPKERFYKPRRRIL